MCTITKIFRSVSKKLIAISEQKHETILDYIISSFRLVISLDIPCCFHIGRRCYGTMSQDIYPFLGHNSVTSLYFPIFLSVLCPSPIPDIQYIVLIPRSKMLLDWIYRRMFCKQCYILGGGYLSICPGRALCPFFTQMFDPSPSTSRGEGRNPP
jgi:hypothetical protein